MNDARTKLRDRITWREGIQPQTLISEDRGLMARTFGSAYAMGGLLGLALLVFGASTNRDDAVILALSLAALGVSAFCVAVYTAIPRALFHAMATLGTLMITVAMTGGSDGEEAVYGLLYIWVVFISFFFFTTRAATLQALVAVVAYAAVLIAKDAPFTFNLLLVASGTIGTSAAILGLLRGRMEQIASGFETEANTDPVTAIGNRRDFDARFEHEVERARSTGRPLSLMICDLDRFKRVNDVLGHEQGDAALRKAATAIGNSVRGIDAVARLGGEEFAVLLPDTDLDMATAVAERVRAGIRAEFRSYPIELTASCGLACTSEVTPDSKRLFRAADAALYTAKHGGRDRTVSATAQA